MEGLELSKHVGKLIAFYRDLKGMTQVEFSRKLCVTRRTLVRYETGEGDIKLSTIKEIAEKLEIEPKQLLPEDWR